MGNEFVRGDDMAKRDITEIVKLVPDGYLPPAYELNSDDLTFLYRKAQEPDGLFKVIGMSVAYGYVMGHRATINGTYIENKELTINEMGSDTDTQMEKPRQCANTDRAGR